MRIDIDLPMPIAAAIDAMRDGDGIGVADNFTIDGRTTVILDGPLRKVLGWENNVKVQGRLPIAGCAAAFAGNIAPEALTVLTASSRGKHYRTVLACTGRVRRTPIVIPGKSIIVWRLADDRRKICHAIIKFRTELLWSC